MTLCRIQLSAMRYASKDERLNNKMPRLAHVRPSHTVQNGPSHFAYINKLLPRSKKKDFLRDCDLGELPGNINQLIARTSAQITCFADHEIGLILE